MVLDGADHSDGLAAQSTGLASCEDNRETCRGETSMSLTPSLSEPTDSGGRGMLSKAELKTIGAWVLMVLCGGGEIVSGIEGLIDGEAGRRSVGVDVHGALVVMYNTCVRS